LHVTQCIIERGRHFRIFQYGLREKLSLNGIVITGFKSDLVHSCFFLNKQRSGLSVGGLKGTGISIVPSVPITVTFWYLFICVEQVNDAEACRNFISADVRQSIPNSESTSISPITF